MNELTKKIVNGDVDNKKIWVCLIYYFDYFKKLTRHVKPQEATVFKGSYGYAKSYFVGKKGIIKLFSNVSFDNTPVQCFHTQEECVQAYKRQCQVAISGLEEVKIIQAKRIADEISKLENRMK